MHELTNSLQPTALKPSACVSLMMVLQVAIGLIVSTGRAGEPTSVPWSWEKTVVPRVLIVDGLWGEYFKAGEAADKAGMRYDGNLQALVNSGGKYSVVVLANVQADHLGAGILNSLKAFVENGGGLVVLGGFAAYASGGYAGTPLEAMLPVSLAGTECGYGAQAGTGALLNRPAESDWPTHVNFEAKPLAYYFHTLVPKSDARVQLRVGQQPAIVSGTFGKGRVVACSLMANGDPAAGALPFWDWKEWPGLLAQVLTWSAGARPAGVAGAVIGPVSTLKPLTDDEISAAELDMEALPPNFVQRALVRPNARLAAVLFDQATVTEGKPKCSLATVGPALMPYVRPEWGSKLLVLAGPENPDKEVRNMALVLLGATRVPAAYGILVSALAEPATSLAAMDGLAALGKKEAIPLLKAAYEKALKPAQLPAGPGRWEPAAFADACLAASHSATALYLLGDPEGVNRLMRLARDIKLYQRVFLNAAKRKVSTTDAQGLAGLKRIWEGVGNLNQAWDYLAGRIGPIPEAQQAQFVAYARNTEDPVEIRLMGDAIEKSTGQLTPATLKILMASKSGMISLLSQRMKDK